MENERQRERERDLVIDLLHYTRLFVVTRSRVLRDVAGSSCVSSLQWSVRSRYEFECKLRKTSERKTRPARQWLDRSELSCIGGWLATCTGWRLFVIVVLVVLQLIFCNLPGRQDEERKKSYKTKNNLFYSNGVLHQLTTSIIFSGMDFLTFILNRYARISLLYRR